MKKLLLSALAVSVMFVSCNKDNDNPVQPKKADVTAKGVFKDIFTIQNDMYSATSNDLVGTFDKIKSDIAVDYFSGQYKAEVQGQFTDWLKNVKPEGDASNGTAGKVMDGEKARYLNAKGVETGQLIKKGFIGAYQLSNALKEGTRVVMSKLDPKGRKDVLEKFATALLGSYSYIDNEKIEMESEGSKFMGYPVMEGNEFAKYLNVVAYANDDKDLDLYAALKAAKSVVDDDDKAETFKSNMSKAFVIAQKVVAIRGIQYLKVGEELGDKDKFAHVAHEISEGLGFVYSLQFTYNGGPHRPFLSKDDVKVFFDKLNLWDTQAAKTSLEEMSKKIAKEFNLNWEEIKKA